MAEIENTILIVVDGLRFDRVGTSITPNINSISEDGESFNRCFSCSNVTDSCLTTILTGQYPTRHGIISHGVDFSKETLEQVAATYCLPGLMQSEYVTLGVNRKKRWHKRGFDRYADPSEPDPKEQFEKSAANVVNRLPTPVENIIKDLYDSVDGFITDDDVSEKDEFANYYPEASKMTRLALDLIEDTDDPWFLNLHYWDTHLPYNPLASTPPEVAERSYKNGSERLDNVIEPIAGSPWAELLQDLVGDSVTVGDMIQKYETGLWHVDKGIGQIVDYLKSNDIYDETAIVITADHGESFTEHGILFEHHGLYDVTTHVPLIIKAPGFAGTEDMFVQSFDIAPTLLDLADVEYNPEWFDGASLSSERDSLDRDAAYMESAHKARKRSVRTDSYRYIKALDPPAICDNCGISHAPDVELYSIADDPLEVDNIADENEHVVEKLDGKLESWITDIPNSQGSEVNFDIPNNQLEDLGYL